MISAILYTSNTGTTAKYARILGEKTGLPVYPLDKAQAVAADTEIIYLGWIMASGVQGYKKASKRYRVRAVCGVCMGATGSQIAEVRQKNSVPESIPVFTMQGGFDINKLHGVYKAMMSVMVKTTGKSLSAKPDRTPDENDTLEMMLHGAERVSEENLKAVLDWYAGVNG
ncbi:MAG: hypothetical protein PHD67_06855 [Oscillospiraceae bacterium]|nr:hypothetical protein [Oscillospiraceae bacterium]